MCLFYILIDMSCRNMCEIDTKHKIGSTILLIFWMYMFLIIAFFIKIIVVNNGLRSFDLVSKKILINYIF